MQRPILPQGYGSSILVVMGFARITLTTTFIAALAGDVEAHPGGTDQYGCHVESATGIRHCHGDGDGGTDIEFASVAEIGAELAHGVYSGPSGWIGLHVGGYLQHNGSLLGLGGITFHYHSFSEQVVTFIDFGIGAASMDEADRAGFGFRMSAGLKIGLVGGHSSERNLHLKTAVLMEFIADGINGEPIGVALLLGGTL